MVGFGWFHHPAFLKIPVNVPPPEVVEAKIGTSKFFTHGDSILDVAKYVEVFSPTLNIINHRVITDIPLFRKFFGFIRGNWACGRVIRFGFLQTRLLLDVRVAQDLDINPRVGDPRGCPAKIIDLDNEQFGLNRSETACGQRLRMYSTAWNEPSAFNIDENICIAGRSRSTVSSSLGSDSGLSSLIPNDSERQTGYHHQGHCQADINFVPRILFNFGNAIHDYVPWLTFARWCFIFILVFLGRRRSFNRRRGGYLLLSCGLLIGLCGSANRVSGCLPRKCHKCWKQHEHQKQGFDMNTNHARILSPCKLPR